MDYAEVLAINLVIEGPGGTFRDVVKTFEGSTTDADLRNTNTAPAVGMIRADEELTEAFDNPAVIVELQP